MEGISLDIEEISWWTDVVCQTANGGGVSSHIELLPFSKEAHKEVTLKLAMENLGDKVEV